MKGRDAGWHRKENERSRHVVERCMCVSVKGGSLNPTKGKARNCSQRERWTTEDRLREAYQTGVD